MPAASTMVHVGNRRDNRTATSRRIMLDSFLKSPRLYMALKMKEERENDETKQVPGADLSTGNPNNQTKIVSRQGCANGRQSNAA